MQFYAFLSLKIAFLKHALGCLRLWRTSWRIETKRYRRGGSTFLNTVFIYLYAAAHALMMFQTYFHQIQNKTWNTKQLAHIFLFKALSPELFFVSQLLATQEIFRQEELFKWDVNLKKLLHPSVYFGRKEILVLGVALKRR